MLSFVFVPQVSKSLIYFLFAFSLLFKLDKFSCSTFKLTDSFLCLHFVIETIPFFMSVIVFFCSEIPCVIFVSVCCLMIVLSYLSYSCPDSSCWDYIVTLDSISFFFFFLFFCFFFCRQFFSLNVLCKNRWGWKFNVPLSYVDYCLAKEEQWFVPPCCCWVGAGNSDLHWVTWETGGTGYPLALPNTPH